MDLSEAATDGGSSAATSAAHRGHRSSRETTMKPTITVTEAMFMSDDTPNEESRSPETHSIEPTSVDGIRNSVDGLCCGTLPGEID